jgi:hypothetical protein
MAKWSFIVRPCAKVAVMKSIFNVDYNRLKKMSKRILSKEFLYGAGA